MLERDGFELELVSLPKTRSAQQLLPGDDNPGMIKGSASPRFRSTTSTPGCHG